MTTAGKPTITVDTKVEQSRTCYFENAVPSYIAPSRSFYKFFGRSIHVDGSFVQVN
jgi:hypothetical protein